MAKVELHDGREYTLSFGRLDLSVSANFRVPIPQAGQVLRISYVVSTTTVGVTVLVYFIGGTAMTNGGVAASLTIPDSSPLGTHFVQTFDPIAKANYVRESEQGDTPGSLAAIRISSDGGASVCLANFLVTIRQ